MYRRRNKILYLETALTIAVITLWLIEYFHAAPLIATLTGVASGILFTYLFFINRIVRYFLSILFSFVWAGVSILVFQFFNLNYETKEWVLAIAVFVLSLWAHKDHFSFLKSATTLEYDKI